MLASLANVSDVGGAISPDCRDAAGSIGGLLGHSRSVTIGAVAGKASAADDGSADGFSDGWNATSTM